MSVPDSSAGEFRFSYKRLRDHAIGCFSYWKFCIATTLAVFGGLWTIAEVATEYFEANAEGWNLKPVGSKNSAELQTVLGIGVADTQILPFQPLEFT